MRRLTLALALLVGGAFAVPDTAFARPSAESSLCKKKKRSKKRRRKAKKAKRKITAKTIKRWQKKGWSNEKIVKKAQARGYKVTKRERRKLKKLRVRKSLRLALAKPAAAPAAKPAPSGPKRIDIEAEMDPNDIDFDSVAPPAGMDMRFADAHRAEKGK